MHAFSTSGHSIPPYHIISNRRALLSDCSDFIEKNRPKKSILFVSLGYLLVVFIVLPVIAPLNGRTALPLSGRLAPYNFLTCLLNRHYVTIDAKNVLEDVTLKMTEKHDDITIRYLDANFPFITGFPLLPHLSHSDGKKLDLAFNYLKDNSPTNNSPSLFGYGYFEAPVNREIDYPDICTKKGFWQYSFTGKLFTFFNKKGYSIDVDKTAYLLKLLHDNGKTEKLFLEPHLKERWHLSGYEKIRFHGCHAVRHDDHIHWQIK